MYDKAKVCVNVNNTCKLSKCASHTGVRQGENLSLALFTLFVNDLSQYISSKRTGLESLSQATLDYLRDVTIEVYLKYLYQCTFLQTKHICILLSVCVVT